MALDEEALQIAANGGPIDSERWNGMAAPLIERLEYIVYNVFPMPQTRPEHISQQTFLNRTPQADTVPSESINKEASASELMAPPRLPGSPPASARVPDSQPQPSGASMDNQLPPPLALLLSAIRSSINSFFTEKPPHTIQRLAELILYPTKHYRTLPAYLRAVDRVVSVTSSADIFPFQSPAVTDAPANGLVQPGNSGGVYMTPDHAHGLGSDESLGGALLTPISWLSNTSFDSDDANGDTDVLVEATGEPIPVQSEDQPGLAIQALSETEERVPSASPEPSDEVPHARGPIRLGVEDMGLQDGKGVEMNLGTEGAADVPAAIEEQEQRGESVADNDGNVVPGEDKPKEGEEALNEGAPTGLQTGDSSQAPEAEKTA